MRRHVTRRVIRQADPSGYRRIVETIRGLADDPRSVGSLKLTGVDPPAWRTRVGDHRIVYEIDDQAVVIVVVVNVAPRGGVYRSIDEGPHLSVRASFAEADLPEPGARAVSPSLGATRTPRPCPASPRTG